MEKQKLPKQFRTWNEFAKWCEANIPNEDAITIGEWDGTKNTQTNYYVPRIQANAYKELREKAREIENSGFGAIRIEHDMSIALLQLTPNIGQYTPIFDFLKLALAL